MMNKNVQLMYDTVFCIPGMNENVRIDVKVSRKLVLLLSQVVERGLASRDGEGMIDAMPPEAITELQELMASCMERSGLTELGKKLKSVGQLKG